MAVGRGSDVLEASQVRIHAAAGGVVGAGFLIAADVVCTCAHVVARALRTPDDAEHAPDRPVDLDFPLLDGRPRARATVVSWRHGGADVALLRLEGPVAGARPASLVDGTGVWGHTFRVQGYPVGADHGKWASGILRAGQGLGWTQMEAHEPGPVIAEGFSGAPVWDDAQDGVVGMTVAADRADRTAYLLPSADLVDERTVPPRCPFRGLAPFTEDDAEFFHGRDDDTARVRAAVRRRLVTLVAGPSGCGKSSLVRAGVLPGLRDDGMVVSELRPVPGVRASAVIARALTGVLEPRLGEVDRLVKAEELAGLLETGDDVPAEVRARVLARAHGTGHVLFVDQLEEYSGAEPEAARALFGLLAALAGGGPGGAVLRVVATARPDSLDALVTTGTSDLISDAVEFLAPLADEDLERAVTAPVDAVPGLWFEPGLPQRIVADAGAEPGRMPLVQFALTELWNRRSRSMLTHSAYDELGGVAGALVTYADHALAGLTAARQECARRLFVQLARPADGDTFSRRPVRTGDLAPELLALARELAPGKLVVLSRAPGGSGPDEVVDLAHEALTRLWPRLRTWLAESRDFRRRQEQLRADLHRWQTRNREPARLLSGSDLAEAERALAEHPEDISADERAYVLLSRRHARRGTRLRQAAVGALAVLTVLAVVLAVSTWHSLAVAERQLRTQAAGLLAQLSEDRPATDPATALQLALAAWKTDRSAHTRQALLRQYARGQYLVGSHPSVWRGRATGLDATPDGRVLVVQSKPGGGDRPTMTVVTGAIQGEPRARGQLAGVPEGKLLTALSPDGRHFAATAGEEVLLWRLSDPAHPRTLELGDHELPEDAGGALDFSSDGKRLLRTTTDNGIPCHNGDRRCVPAFIQVWDIPSGARVPLPDGLLPETGLSEAAFTSDRNTLATVSYTHDELRQRIEVRDLATGRLRHASTTGELGGALLRDGGELLLRTQIKNPYAQELGRTPGRRTALPDDVDTADATARHGVDLGAENTEAGYAEATLTELRTGRAYRTRVPTVGEVAGYGGVAAVRHQGGGLTVLAPVGTALIAVRAEPAGGARFLGGGGKYSVSPDGRYIALADDRRLEVLDASRMRHRSVSLPAPPDSVDWVPLWTADSQRIVVWGEQGNLQGSYPVRDLSDGVPLDDVVPAAKELDRDRVTRGGEVDAVTALKGSEIALLTVEGGLTRVDAADGTVLTRSFLVHPAPNWSGGGFDRQILARGQLLARPGHPGQVAAITRTGTLTGEILLWDVTVPRRIGTLPSRAVSVPFSTSYVTGPLAFDTDGSRLAVQNTDGQVRAWDVDRRRALPGGAPATGNDALIGFGPENSIVTAVYGKDIVRIHGLTDDGASVTLPIADGDWVAGYVRDRRLTVDSGRLRQTFDLRPEEQFRTLCAAAGRDYTGAERRLLPKGTPPGPPCG
ncbi:nSTAND1 domain-containing NTPase [Streptomyces sp. enrichment culture]|uniref:nSTAND1 domain-containing NTPase n=1 Tax=Streptomyces sp. enrichment culture TaxID=1795815 RepID=UPI003F564894